MLSNIWTYVAVERTSEQGTVLEIQTLVRNFFLSSHPKKQFKRINNFLKNKQKKNLLIHHNYRHFSPNVWHFTYLSCQKFSIFHPIANGKQMRHEKQRYLVVLLGTVQL